MTEVLQVPRQPDGQSYYQNSALRRSSPSSSSLFLDTAGLSSSPKATAASTPHAEHQERLPVSLPPSSASSFSSISNATTLDSAFDSTNSSIDTDLTLDTDLDFPNYDDVSYRHDSASTGVPPSSPAFCDDSSEPTQSTCTDTTRSDSPLPTPTVVDDSAIKQEPSRQVDFLSHDWREEDIWASWRHIVSQRKAVYGERSRLENASWRTWAKTKFDLDTVSPERLNWLKESDVTWLYGPLKSAESYPITQNTSEPGSQISKNNSFINKKPILKKRSMSEVMLQKSISSSSLVKQAASAVQLSGRGGRRYGTMSDIVDSKLQSETPSRDQVDYFTSRSTSSGGTPCETQERRHIRFDDRVEQCIAIDCKDPALDEEEEESSEEEDDVKHNGSTDSSSDDGIVMMKRKKLSGQKRKKAGSRSSSTSGRRIIETLPATTLKYRTDSPDVTEEAQHHTFGRSWNTANLSPSPSQETLRPANPSRNFLLQQEHDNDDEVDSDSSWSFGASNPKSSFALVDRRPGGPSSSRARNASPGPGPRSGDYEIEGMRRTSSGMFMPIDDEEEDDAVATGLFGRVSETINTARDIAHVIWNVGWRN
ncbi:hypothetical protein CLAFUW4_00851 [Fulvia fulva]|uniref:Nitrogen regulatory protein areA GATA-like domain-containing protein n=1 Tax=Passalora fulva TaxID=5499 RepID=A0A9Q8L6Z8_PASFU|nr:uncharacterized protein CLAFUR5_00854 [Fulvia fulva]KAK4635547.1 hypothetical protein CLAFUR4_00852 [Fulvia fulva]KAK4637975.1 hypothetical protein CLAFUR0_00852 [Fulvia fulva]UJO11936.1 hypothetical protein CLAFUR5_00854 [Fulvia fulva]WPV08904.1 hypothetical protein CLAFUW4_00851 [Fulvia fulva]WPV24819.1 hypothetical protein CLAFUW7_00965 [Fulvia fulva]